MHDDSTKIVCTHDELFVFYPAILCSSIVGNKPSLLLPKPHCSSFDILQNLEQPNHLTLQSYQRRVIHAGSINSQPIAMAPGASTNQTIREFYTPRSTAKKSPESMPASPNNHDIREFYGPRTTGPLRQSQQQPVAPVEHQAGAGLLGEIKNYKSGDEFVLLWKWVDDFMDKRRAKNKSSKSDNVNKSTSRQLKPTTSSTRVGQAPGQVVPPSPEAVRRQATVREDMREYSAQRHTPWGELSYLYHDWKDQKAEKKADRATQRKPKEIAKSQVINHRDDAPGGRPTNPREHPQPTPSPLDQASQPAVAGNPKPVYNKKRGEVKQHTVTIALPPVHNSVHLKHTPSNNYGTGPSTGRGQKDRTRDTRFSDFVHQRNAPPSQKPAPSRGTQWTYAVRGQENEFVRNNRYSSIHDPAKAKKAQEAQKAQNLQCYICGSSNCMGEFRDIISKLWVCGTCQKHEGIEPVQCAVCGEPSTPNSGYHAGNGLWMCSTCSNPKTPKEFPPSPKLGRKNTSRPKANRPPIPQGEAKSEDTCECNNACPPIEKFDNKICICPICDRPLTPFPVLLPTASHAPLPSEGIYDDDHLYSDDEWEPPTTTAPPQGLGLKFHDSEVEEGEGREKNFRPTPPLKDSKYYHESPTLPPMDYNTSYLRQPGAKHPYAPPSPPSIKPTTTARKASAVSFTHDIPKVRPSPKKHHHPSQQSPPFNPATYTDPSPPNSLHKPRPASSIYPTDEHPTPDFPYPPPPIPLRFVNRPQRSSSVIPDMLSKAALARPMGSPRSQSSDVSSEGRVLRRRSS